MTVLASFGGIKPAKSLAFPRNVASNVKLDTKNHILVKGTSKYCRCKHYGCRSIYLCQNAMLPYTLTVSRTHLWNTKRIVLFPTGNTDNVNQPLFSEKIRHFIIVSLASPVFRSSLKPAVFRPYCILRAGKVCKPWEYTL